MLRSIGKLDESCDALLMLLVFRYLIRQVWCELLQITCVKRLLGVVVAVIALFFHYLLVLSFLRRRSSQQDAAHDLIANLILVQLMSFFFGILNCNFFFLKLHFHAFLVNLLVEIGFEKSRVVLNTLACRNILKFLLDLTDEMFKVEL